MKKQSKPVGSSSSSTKPIKPKTAVFGFNVNGKFYPIEPIETVRIDLSSDEGGCSPTLGFQTKGKPEDSL